MDHFAYHNGVYHAEELALPELAAQVGTPFYCYSRATLERHYRVFTENLKPLNPMVCFAVKANSSLAVLSTLARLGSGADVVSEGEIRRALAAGVPAERIVFSGVAMRREELAFAVKAGIFQFNVESIPELELLNEVALALDATAPVAIRVNPDVAAGTHIKISTGQKESKFGVNMQEAAEAYALASTLSGIRVKGVSVHIGSQLTSLAPFAAAFKRVRIFAEELRAAGQPISVLDLGGGLGIPYGREMPPSPGDYAAKVKQELEGCGFRLVFEPGRLLAGNAGILVTKVLYVKRSGERIFVMVDAGMNDLMRPALYDAYHEIVPVREMRETDETQAVDIVGPVCENNDIFAEQRAMILPQPGDLLAFRSAGAYGGSMANTYNSRPLVLEVIVHGGEYCISRARQSYAQMLENEKIPDWA